MAKLTDNEIARWTKYAMKIECDRCSEFLFPHEDDAKEEVIFVADHYDLNSKTVAADWRLYLRDRTSGLCDYCEHMDTKDD